jgi:HEPN domain-containing protein
MNRKDLIELTKIRLREARALLKNRNYDGAYYLFGYVVECGLKACIAKQTKKHDFPNKITVNQSYTHDLTQLVKVAGLELALDLEMKRNPKFERNWAVVKDWSEDSRYEKHTDKEAQDLYSAIVDIKDGVFKWIKHHW